MIISGPTDAKYVGGVNTTGNAQSIVDTYFNKPILGPDGLPSHTFVATRNVKVPRRADPTTSTIRRPNTSLRRSLSKLRTRSITHISEIYHKSEPGSRVALPAPNFGCTTVSGSLRKQSSMLRLRQSVALEKDLYRAAPISKLASTEPEVVSEVVRHRSPPLLYRKPVPRVRTNYEPEALQPNIAVQRNHTLLPRQIPTVQRKASTNTERRPPLEQQSLAHAINRKQPSTRPTRADSGTTIDFNGVPADERPLGFKEILAVESFQERLRHYQKAREYWAHVDHGCWISPGGATQQKAVATQQKAVATSVKSVNCGGRHVY